MRITPDSHILGRRDGEVSFSAFPEASEALIHKIRGFAPVSDSDRDGIGFLVARTAEIKTQR
jgi:hypothetical protein